MTNKKHKAHKKNVSINLERGKKEKNNGTELENIGFSTIVGIESNPDLLQKQDLKIKGFL